MRPPIWRVVLAFLIAPLLATFPIACLATFGAGPAEISLAALKLAAVVAYPGGLLLGVPAYYWVRGRAPLTIQACAGFGAALGPVTPLVVAAILSVAEGPQWNTLMMMGMFAVLGVGAGAFGGSMFWVIAAAGRPTSARPSSDGRVE